MDREWKLGKDLCLSDNLLDPVTFDDIVVAVTCNCPEIDKVSVVKQIREIMELRMKDMRFLVDNNVDEIVEEAKRQRGQDEA